MIPRKLIVAVIALLFTVAGLGLYVFHLKHRAEQQPARPVEAPPIAPPTAGPATTVTLFVANDEDGRLSKRELSLALPQDASKRAQAVLHALVRQYQEPSSSHPLGPEADVTEVYLVRDHLAVVDANAAFASTHRSGILVEELTLASLAQTLAANLPVVTRIKLLIDGKERSTLAGHADLLEPYDVAGAARLAK